MADKKTKSLPKADIITVHHDTGSYPAMLIDGDAPKGGIKFAALYDGKAYEGVVSKTETREDGKTVVAFRDWIKPIE